MTTDWGQEQPITRDVLLDARLAQAKDTHRVRRRRCSWPTSCSARIRSPSSASSQASTSLTADRTGRNYRRRSAGVDRAADYYIDVPAHAWYKESARASTPASQVPMG